MENLGKRSLNQWPWFVFAICLWVTASESFAVPIDLDDDEIPNLIETEVGLDPNNNFDGSLDLDGDGWSNVDEYRLGTQIDDANSSPSTLNEFKHQKVFASDGVADDHFGISVSLSGDSALIGAFRDDELGEISGSAYVFVRDSQGLWRQQAKLLAYDGERNDNFGFSVSLSGDSALVGAWGKSNVGLNYYDGSAYVFTRDGNGIWGQQAKLTASDGSANDQFGYSVSLSGDSALIGAHFDDDQGPGSGSAYVFIRNSSGVWSQQAKLTSTDGLDYDYFGSSVSLSSDSALIGAIGNDLSENPGGAGSGSAYVFTRDGQGAWSQQAKLNANDGAAGDYFGYSVALSNDTALIGALYHDDPGVDTGSSYVFTRDNLGNWSQQAKLIASDGTPGGRFGNSVALAGDSALIGADQDDDLGNLSGSTYFFDLNKDVDNDIPLPVWSLLLLAAGLLRFAKKLG